MKALKFIALLTFTVGFIIVVAKAGHNMVNNRPFFDGMLTASTYTTVETVGEKPSGQTMLVSAADASAILPNRNDVSTATLKQEGLGLYPTPLQLDGINCRMVVDQYGKVVLAEKGDVLEEIVGPVVQYKLAKHPSLSGKFGIGVVEADWDAFLKLYQK